MSERPKRLEGSRYNPADPDNRFPWGPVDAVHKIGQYAIVEYRQDLSTFSTRDYSDHGRTLYRPYIDGKDTCRSFESLDDALVGAIGYRHEGPNGSAAFYFMRMTGQG